MAMKPNNTHDPNIINFNYDADEELYVSDPGGRACAQEGIGNV